MWLNMLTMTAPAETARKLKTLDRAVLMKKSRDQILESMKRIGKSPPRELIAIFDSFELLNQPHEKKN